jgi:hypothetical protein
VGDLYTDPQIHTLDGEGYGEGNLGARGMALFFRCVRAPACVWRSLGVGGGRRQERQWHRILKACSGILRWPVTAAVSASPPMLALFAVAMAGLPICDDTHALGLCTGDGDCRTHECNPLCARLGLKPFHRCPADIKAQVCDASTLH